MIKKRAARALYDASRPLCIICDLDGTLVDSAFDAPCAGIMNDKVIGPVADILARYYAALSGYKKIYLFLCTSRKEAFRTATVHWLEVNGIRYDALFMREGNDPAKDTVVKKEIFERHIDGKFNVLFVLEDRPSVCEMWVKLGLFVLNCNQDPMCRNPF